MFTKEAIKEMLLKSDAAVERGLVVLLSRQTAEEQVTEMTREHNGMGFSAFDAEFMTSLAKQVERKLSFGSKLGQCLSEKQMVYARKKIMRYAGQLAEVANNKIVDALQNAVVAEEEVEADSSLETVIAEVRAAKVNMSDAAKIAVENAIELARMEEDAKAINARDAEQDAEVYAFKAARDSILNFVKS